MESQTQFAADERADTRYNQDAMQIKNDTATVCATVLNSAFLARLSIIALLFLTETREHLIDTHLNLNKRLQNIIYL
jgi:hypothetical protein